MARHRMRSSLISFQGNVAQLIRAISSNISASDHLITDNVKHFRRMSTFRGIDDIKQI